MSSIIGTCQKCGYRYDFLRSNCPNCRLQAMQKAFAPIDPLRTALGIQGLREDAELDGVFHWHGEEYPGRLCAPKESFAEIPQGCKMPKSEDGQIYELKRLFKL